jgi:Terpene cyclase DEP1
LKARTLYLWLCVLGTVIPYSQLVPFLREHGFDIRLLVDQLFANRISAFFGLDVILSTVALWIFVGVERKRAGIRHAWAPLGATLLVGVSLGLPLFLYLRERQVAAPNELEVGA